MTYEDSGFGLEDEDEDSDDDEKYIEKGPKKFLFCIPWDPIHYLHAAVFTFLLILGVTNGIMWIVVALKEREGEFKYAVYGLIHLWCQMPLAVAAYFYLRYLYYRRDVPELKEDLCDAHYLMMLHCITFQLWALVGGLVFIDKVVNGYFFSSGSSSDPYPTSILYFSGAQAIGGFCWNFMMYKITEKFARPWPSIYSYKYDD